MKADAKWKGRALVFLALATVPVTIYALGGTYLDISGWGRFGYSNYVSGSNSVAIGYNNNVTNAYSLAVGYGLNSAGGYQVVAGKWNATSSNAYLVVGDGTGSGASTSDAFIVHSNGETEIVKLKLQGDLSMGSYTSSP